MLIKDNKKFYIIGTTRDITGIGAILIGYIGHALYAINNQMIPVIDLKHYKNQYFKDGRTYKDNTWEYFCFIVYFFNFFFIFSHIYYIIE